MASKCARIFFAAVNLIAIPEISAKSGCTPSHTGRSWTIAGPVSLERAILGASDANSFAELVGILGGPSSVNKGESTRVIYSWNFGVFRSSTSVTCTPNRRESETLLFVRQSLELNFDNEKILECAVTESKFILEGVPMNWRDGYAISIKKSSCLEILTRGKTEAEGLGHGKLWSLR